MFRAKQVINSELRHIAATDNADNAIFGQYACFSTDQINYSVSLQNWKKSLSHDYIYINRTDVLHAVKTLTSDLMLRRLLLMTVAVHT